MMDTTKFLRLLLEDEDARVWNDGIDYESDDAEFLHSVFSTCFIDWTREDLLSCFDDNTELYTANDYTNNYFIKHKGELRYGSIVDPYSTFIASDVMFLDDYFSSNRFKNLTVINSKAVINNPLLSTTISIGDSSEVNIINKTGTNGGWSRVCLNVIFHQSVESDRGNKFSMTSEVVDKVLEQIDLTFLDDCSDSKAVIDLKKYYKVHRVNISFGGSTRDNMVELINVPKDVTVNTIGDGSYNNKVIVNNKLHTDPTYLAC